MNLRKHELIGLDVEVLHATDPSQAHVRGRVVDETRNTLVLEIQGDQRAVGIKNVTFNDIFFQGHYPGTPIMPGVLIVEAMA